MHIVVLFYNIGGYHAARLRAAAAVCAERGWQLTAVQETDSAQEHPWGDLAKEITFPIETLLPAKDAPDASDRHPQSPLAAYRLKACLTRLSPDVLAIPGWGSPSSRAALRWAKKHQRPTVLMSESKWNDEPRTWWKETIKSLLYTRQFKSALVGGQLHADYLLKLKFPAEAISLGYDIVDNAHFAEQAEQAKKDPLSTRQQQPNIPESPYFIVVTRFIPRKNVLRLIDAYAQYRSQCPAPKKAWDLVICGSGTEESNIRSRILSHHLEHSVHLPGFKSYQQISQWFGLANAFIHPALSEQWGLVVNEALASGLPVIVSNRCGCFPELIREGVNGFGFDPENTEQLAQLMAKVSQGAVDLATMSQAALAHIEHFSPAAFGKGFQQSVQHALSE